MPLLNTVKMNKYMLVQVSTQSQALVFDLRTFPCWFRIFGTSQIWSGVFLISNHFALLWCAYVILELPLLFSIGIWYLLMLLLDILGNVFCIGQSILLLANLWGQALVSDLGKISKWASWSIIFSCKLKHFCLIPGSCIWPQKFVMLIPHFWDISNLVRLWIAYVILELLLLFSTEIWHV